MTVTKTAAKSVSLPVGSATALLAYANDAGNWSGTPYTGAGNVNFGKSTAGYIAKLVAAGYVESHGEGDDAYISFTDAGIDAALQLGASDSINAYRSTPVEVAPKPVKVCKKDPSHGEHRITKSGSYCYICDRIVAERQKAERAAAKAAAK